MGSQGRKISLSRPRASVEGVTLGPHGHVRCQLQTRLTRKNQKFPPPRLSLERPSLSLKEAGSGGWGGDPYLGSTCCGCSNASGIKGLKIAVLAPSPAGMSLGELAALRRPPQSCPCVGRPASTVLWLSHPEGAQPPALEGSHFAL